MNLPCTSTLTDNIKYPLHLIYKYKLFFYKKFTLKQKSLNQLWHITDTLKSK